MKPIKSAEFKVDVAYIVTKGNDNYSEGDIIWIDSKANLMNNAGAGGWYDNGEINETLDGMECEPTRDYIVETDNRGTRLHYRKHLEDLLNRN